MTSAAQITLRQSHVAYLASTGAMSPTELWLFGLSGFPGEAVADAQDAAPDDVSPTVAPGIGLVAVGADRIVVAGGDHRLGLRFVHDDQGETQRLQPPSQGLGHAPCDPAPVAARPAARRGAGRGLDLGAVAVGPADPVVQRLLTDAESLTPAAQQSSQRVFIADDGRSNCHVAPLNKDAPHER